jgi:large subunit ribosomal protein L19
MTTLEKISQEQCKAEIGQFRVGDTVQVHTLIIEGNKERTQIFAGTVIARGGHGVAETFTVRRVQYGVGVERVFPLHSPRVAKIERTGEARVRRAKLYYLRDRVGKSARVKQKMHNKTK